jgi:hypothetical protein
VRSVPSSRRMHTALPRGTSLPPIDMAVIKAIGIAALLSRCWMAPTDQRCAVEPPRPHGQRPRAVATQHTVGISARDAAALPRASWLRRVCSCAWGEVAKGPTKKQK